MKIDSARYFVEVALVPGEQVIDDDDSVRSLRQQTPDERRSNEPRATRYEKSLHSLQCAMRVQRIVSPARETS